MTARLRRLPDAAAAIRHGKALERREAWSREGLARFVRARLLATVRDAAVRSPYYREQFAGISLDDDLDLAALPTLDKATMLASFDQIVTDPRLRLAELEAHLEGIEGDARYLGAYRVMASGGTTGRRGIYVYGPREWPVVIGGLLRWFNAYLGTPPRLPRRRRLAVVAADTPLHMSARMASTIDIGVHRVLRLDARAPLGELAGQLQAFQPESLSGYPSALALLADEQLAGRLAIAPAVVSTTSEVRTDEMEARMVAAWGQAPFNAYATTETGFLAADCDRHAGMHLFEDLACLEVVDAAGAPVPAGTEGARVLVTNLVNRTQPLIRMELTDLVTMSPEPCPCGRPFPLLARVEGRSDDVLRLPGLGGGTVALHPLALRSPLAAVAGLRQYRIVHEPGRLTVQAVVANGGRGIPEAVAGRLQAALDGAGACAPEIAVEIVREIDRHPQSGKLKLIESRA